METDWLKASCYISPLRAMLKEVETLCNCCARCCRSRTRFYSCHIHTVQLSHCAQYCTQCCIMCPVLNFCVSNKFKKIGFWDFLSASASRGQTFFSWSKWQKWLHIHIVDWTAGLANWLRRLEITQKLNGPPTQSRLLTKTAKLSYTIHRIHKNAGCAKEI